MKIRERRRRTRKRSAITLIISPSISSNSQAFPGNQEFFFRRPCSDLIFVLDDLSPQCPEVSRSSLINLRTNNPFSRFPADDRPEPGCIVRRFLQLFACASADKSSERSGYDELSRPRFDRVLPEPRFTPSQPPAPARLIFHAVHPLKNSIAREFDRPRCFGKSSVHMGLGESGAANARISAIRRACVLSIGTRQF